MFNNKLCLITRQNPHLLKIKITNYLIYFPFVSLGCIGSRLTTSASALYFRTKKGKNQAQQAPVHGRWRYSEDLHTSG